MRRIFRRILTIQKTRNSLGEMAGEIPITSKLLRKHIGKKVRVLVTVPSKHELATFEDKLRRQRKPK